MTSRVRIQLPLLLFGAWSGVGVFVQWGALGCQLGTDHVAGGVAVLEDGALQGIGVKAACGAGVVGDQSFDSSYSDFRPAVGVRKSHGGQAMMHAPVIQELAGSMMLVWALNVGCVPGMSTGMGQVGVGVVGWVHCGSEGDKWLRFRGFVYAAIMEVVVKVLHQFRLMYIYMYDTELARLRETALLCISIEQLTSTGWITSRLQTGLMFTELAGNEWINGDDRFEDGQTQTGEGDSA
ncbi:hypothetical protein AWC38_SpisGene16306 [Stylophora pistillata]|uniref:Uncharacterized protein n=1 Tax=Stylophora pistillata TaxID=50429 RepID=A0A2B4RR68_STYPI|nr:hypothetical protein AWC38_SpisGene16306 [Stylophora pistillata]